MVQKLRHLWGRVEIRVLVFLVFGFLLAGLALAIAQTLKASSSESPFPTVSTWDDLVKQYLDFREHNYALVVPGWYISYGQTEAILKEYGLEELQKEPDWYWNFNEGIYVFDDNSPLAKLVKSGTQIVIYEDMAKEELVVLSAPEKEGGEYKEEIVYAAPKYPEVQKGEDYEQYLFRELSQRRIVWRVTLKSKTLAEEEAAELEAAQAEQKDSGEGEGMRLMMGMEEASNHLWLAIEGPAQGLNPDEIRLTLHWPEGFTNLLELYSFDPNETNTFNGLGSVWQLAATNLLTEGESELTWTDEGQMDRVPVADCTSRFYAVGNVDMDTDSDGINDSRELFIYKTDANNADTDGDGATDGEEIGAGTNPLNNPGDSDQDGLSDDLELVLGTYPNLADSDEDWVSDGYEYEQATDPLDDESAPALRMEVDGGKFYASSTTLEILIRGLVADELILAETLTMENSITNPSSELVYFDLNSEENGDRSVCAVAVRGGTNTRFIATAFIILDTIPPYLSVTNPSSGLITADRWVTIEGLATDGVSSVCVKLNGGWADGVSAGQFWKTHFPLSSGTNLIDITGADDAGNCVTQSWAIVQDLSLDTNAPVMSLDLPSDFTVQGGATNWNYGVTTFGDETNLAFRGSIDDETAVVDLTVESPLGTNGPYYAGVGAGTQVWGEVTLFEGSNRLVATAADAAGNVSTCLWTVIRDTNFMFRITSPLPWQVVNGTSVYVTCVAALEFSNAVVTVNGQAASIVAGSNLTFRTDAAVPLGDGVTKLSACAVLNGQSYYADPNVTTYEITRWMWREQDAYNVRNIYTYDQEDGNEYYNGWDDDQYAWDKDSQVLDDSSRWYWWRQAWDGTQTSYTRSIYTNYPVTSWPPGSGYWTVFGLEKEWWSQRLSIGSWNWSYDSEMRFIKGSMIKDKELVLLQFPNLDYGREPAEPIDPTKIKLKGNVGFWYNSNVTFVAEIERGVEYTIRAHDFDWPAYAYNNSGSGYSYNYSGRWLKFGSVVVMEELKLDSIELVSGATASNVVPPHTWATLKSTNTPADYVLVRAQIESVIDQASLPSGFITWSGGEAVPTNQFMRKVPRDVSAHTELVASCGGLSTTGHVWVMWCDISVRHTGSKTAYDAGTDTGNATNFPAYCGDNTLGGTNRLGENPPKYLGWKVEIEGDIQPAGVRDIVSSGWEFYQTMTYVDFMNSTNTPSASETDAPDIIFNKADFQDRTPDPNDSIFAIDGPGIGVDVNAPDFDYYKSTDNFRTWIHWNGENASDSAQWWIRQKAERPGGIYTVIENNGGNGTTIIDNTY